MEWNVPNILTWMRIILIPLFVGIFYLPETQLTLADKNCYAMLIFVLAAVTDWFDGYLARKWNQTSAFGAFLDPVADKLMVAAALVVLVELGRVGAVVALIIIGREIAISALREWMAGIGQSKGVGVAMIGKIKTAAQMIAIPFLLYYRPIAGVDAKSVGTALIYAAAILTLVSMGYYLKAAWPQMRAK
jgi:cardiolipin synthase